MSPSAVVTYRVVVPGLTAMSASPKLERPTSHTLVAPSSLMPEDDGASVIYNFVPTAATELLPATELFSSFPTSGTTDEAGLDRTGPATAGTMHRRPFRNALVASAAP